MIRHAPPISIEAARAYVHMWRRAFPLVPASVCLTLMEIESSFRPDAHALPPPNVVGTSVQSGAWGLLQLLPSTAADMATRVLKRAADPLLVDVLDTLRLWDPLHAECLTNPALGSLLGVAYLDYLAERFGPGLDDLAAAYHNGPGFLREFKAAGKKIPDDMPPKGKAYVLRAREIWPKYRDDDDTPTIEPPAVA